MSDLLSRISAGRTVEAQELFDYVVEAVIKQGRPSVSPTGGCLYRGPGGTRCAAGHLIPDAAYNNHMEGKNASTVVRDFEMVSLRDHAHLLDDLQAAHDRASDADDYGKFLREFASRARVEAAYWKLSTAVLDRLGYPAKVPA